MQTIYDLDFQEMENMLLAKGQKKYRAKQLYAWLYRQRVQSFEQMTDLPQSLIESLKEDFSMFPLTLLKKQVASDGTAKYLFQCMDGCTIETVLMHFHFGESVCVSSEIGCNMGCTFCASGLLKKQRNLTAGEMTAQILYIQKELDEQQKRVNNVVIMGTGEPFDNYDNVMAFCRIINSDLGLAIGARHITISTCGLVPMINRFAQEHVQYNLAVSLHASNHELRLKLMPVEKAWPLDQLMQSLRDYSSDNNRRLTFEYILLRGINDSDQNAAELAELIREMNAYINLIPYNEVDENGYRTTDDRTALHFYDVLMRHGVKATLRSKHGEDIDAACGQLRAKHEKNREDA